MKKFLNLFKAPNLETLAANPHTAEQHIPKILYGIVFIVAGAFVFFLLWSMFTKINEIARAEGQMIPNGHVQVVQHLEGGIVTDILVREGDLIQRNQLLIKLSDSGSREDLAGLTGKELSLSLQAERLRALVENRQPDYTPFNATAAQILEQENIFKGMENALGSEESVVATQLS